MAKLLLQKKAQINIIDRYGNNPLRVAVFNAYGDYRIVKLFLKYNTNIQNKNRVNRSPLDFAKQINDLDLVNILLNERPNNS
ncbi:ankyrin repeat domain-containing protein [Phocaeicola coprocola]|uniref:ankyrin repeat domain-containing protein n=3 Tax=Phocaeicola coprocola TaxID=310298 RepID=UPI0039797554